MNADETISAITALLPATFYSDRPIAERVQFMVEAWQKVITVSRDEFKENSELRERCEKQEADLAYFRENEKIGKRPFSDAFTGQVCEGQVKTIQRLEKRCLDLVQEISNLREDLCAASTRPGNMEALMGSTIEGQRDRIKELEGPANKFYEIERLLSRRPALDGFDEVGKKVAAMIHMCTTADPSGELMKQLALEPELSPDQWREKHDYLAKGITDVLEGMPGAVRVREGGGPEDLAASLAVSVAKLSAGLTQAK